MSKAKLLKDLVVTDSQSSIDGKEVDVLVTDKGAEIVKSKSQKGDFQEYDFKGALLTSAFTDLSFSLPDPGFEYREDFESAEQLALSAGFHRLCCLPDTEPVIDGKSEVNYYIKNSNNSAIDFLPMGAISKGLKGAEMAELYDMKTAGAIAFCDGDKSIKQAGLLKRALMYSKPFDGLIITFPFDETISTGGMMHEGEVSVSLGLKGFPEISEYLIIKRNLELLRYAGGKMHFSGVSCEESVKIIKDAKKEGLNITCDVRAMNLIFTDKALQDFDSSYKVLPPLRTEKHRKALIKGLKEGTIDAISSGHRPLNIEVKEIEFIYAKYGANTLQSVWSKLLETLGKELTSSQIAGFLSSGPEKVLGLPISTLNLGKIPNFTITKQNSKWELNKESNKSLSSYSPFMNQIHENKVEAVFTKNKLTINK